MSTEPATFVKSVDVEPAAIEMEPAEPDSVLPVDILIVPELCPTAIDVTEGVDMTIDPEEAPTLDPLEIKTEPPDPTIEEPPINEALPPGEEDVDPNPPDTTIEPPLLVPSKASPASREIEPPSPVELEAPKIKISPADSVLPTPLINFKSPPSLPEPPESEIEPPTLSDEPPATIEMLPPGDRDDAPEEILTSPPVPD